MTAVYVCVCVCLCVCLCVWLSESFSDEPLILFYVGTLKLDISPCPTEVKNCLTPELYKVDPYIDSKVRPIKEVVEFPIRDILEPYTTYRCYVLMIAVPVQFSLVCSNC